MAPLTVGEKCEGFGVRVQGETFAELGAPLRMPSIARGTEGFDCGTFFSAYADMRRRLGNEHAFRYMPQVDVHPMEVTRCDLVAPRCDGSVETRRVREDDKMCFAPEDRLLVW